MLPIEIPDVTLAYDTPAGKVTGGQGRQLRHRRFGIRLYRRAVRLRQVHAAQHHRRLPDPAGRRDPHRRPAGHRPRHGPRRRVPGFRPAFPVAHRARQRHLRAGDEGRRQAGARGDRARAIAPGETGEVRRLLSASSVRRHAAAGRHRARARLQSGGAADGRAVRGARRAHPRRDAAAARRRVAGNPQDGDLRDAQRGGGGLSRRPRGGDVAASRHGEGRGQDSACRARATR